LNYFENEASQSHLNYDVSCVRTGNIIIEKYLIGGAAGTVDIPVR